MAGASLFISLTRFPACGSSDPVRRP
ncbi:hypothetical protein A2U01_0093929, partial [Trifolium medium]|nr:hypothetical protein [Trifolium medium]